MLACSFSSVSEMIRNSREGEGDVVGSEIQELVLCRRELGLETEAVLAE